MNAPYSVVQLSTHKRHIETKQPKQFYVFGGLQWSPTLETENKKNVSHIFLKHSHFRNTPREETDTLKGFPSQSFTLFEFFSNYYSYTRIGVNVFDILVVDAFFLLHSHIMMVDPPLFIRIFVLN